MLNGKGGESSSHHWGILRTVLKCKCFLMAEENRIVVTPIFPQDFADRNLFLDLSSCPPYNFSNMG